MNSAFNLLVFEKINSYIAMLTKIIYKKAKKPETL